MFIMLKISWQKNMKVILSFIFLFTFVQFSGFASQQFLTYNIPADKLQTIIDQFIHEEKAPGIIVGVDAWGEQWIGCSGISNIESEVSMTVDTQLRLASVTKTITASLILKLFEEGKLSLDDTLDDWMPGEIINGDQITISMLLNHTSGLHDHENTLEIYEQTINFPKTQVTEQDVIKVINKYPPNFDPGTDYSYCNSGYYLLGMIAEKAGNDTVNQLTKNYLFEPFGMTRTRLTREGTLESPYTPGYALFDDSNEILNIGNWNFSWDWTAGSGVSTVEDLLVFFRNLFLGKILSQETLSQMTTPISPSTIYGYGIESKTGESGRQHLSHTGYNPGTFTGWYYLPQSGMILVFGINYTEYRIDYSYDYQYAGIKLVQDIIDTMHLTSTILNWDLYN